MATKMPGFYMTAYQFAEYSAYTLTSETDYKRMLDDYLKWAGPAAQKNYEKLQNEYNFTKGIPKYRMYVKLADNISKDRRDFIANGIRSFFRDEGTVLLDMEQASG